MARYKSRASRCSDVQSEIQSVICRLEELKEELKDVPEIEDIDDVSCEEYDKERRKAAEEIINKVKAEFASIDSTQVEELADEIESWASGMEGTEIEYTSRYETLSDTLDLLTSAVGYIEQADITMGDEDTVEDIIDQIDDVISDLESADSELDSCEFPGMYGG